MTGTSWLASCAVFRVGGWRSGVVAVQVLVDGADGGAGHEGSQADLDGEPFCQPRDEHCGEQGVPAEVEEVVLGTDLVQAEYLREHLAQRLFPRGGRSQAAACGAIVDRKSV